MGVVLFRFVLSVTAIQFQRFSIVWAECTSCWTPFVGARARMTHQPQLRWRHRVTTTTKKQKQEILKDF